MICLLAIGDISVVFSSTIGLMSICWFIMSSGRRRDVVVGVAISGSFLGVEFG